MVWKTWKSQGISFSYFAGHPDDVMFIILQNYNKWSYYYYIHGRMGWKRRVWEYMLERQRSCGVRWARIRLRIWRILWVECLRWVHKSCSGISGKLKSNVDFHCRRCLEGNHVQSVLLKEVVIELNVKLECVPKFCIWAPHLVQEEVWRRQQESEWDVLGLSSRSYLLSWQLVVHHTT